MIWKLGGTGTAFRTIRGAQRDHGSVRNVELICILRVVGTTSTEPLTTHAPTILAKRSRCNFVCSHSGESSALFVPPAEHQADHIGGILRRV